MGMLRIVFMGTPDFSVPTLSAIAEAGHEVVAVYSQPPRPAGRGMHEQKSPVHKFADNAEIAVLTPRTLRDPAAQETFRTHRADAAVVVAYGLILPRAILDAPRFGCFNLHASALPRWRGAAPIQRAVMAGDSETAASIMRMDEGLDTGPVCATAPIAIGPEMTAGELHDLMAARGAALMVEALAALEKNTLACTPQPPDGVTYAAKIEKAEARIDWARSAAEVHNQIRGLSPWPGAFFEVRHEGRVERLKVLRVTQVQGSGAAGTLLDDAGTIACGDGAVRLIEVQRAGKKPMSLAELLRGFSLPAGTCVLATQADER
ncbi:MAG: methionyl-tRNA formyltransferase [Hyphomicrobium sp.]|nr:methionyl-tRNA formyltransferase [Hyphomicrobium sp.]